jgi:hypothetical protein
MRPAVFIIAYYCHVSGEINTRFIVSLVLVEWELTVLRVI